MDLPVDLGRTAMCQSGFFPGSQIMKRYTVHQKLGSGTFATTYLVTDLKDKESEKVIKRIPCNTVRGDATLPSAKEAKLLGNLRHPFIVQYFGSFLEKNDFCIVTEYCEGGDLDCYIQQQKGEGESFTEGHVIEWLIQLLLGVNYLHERLVIHRDLKPKNIFLKYGMLKIGDFGVSRILASSDMATTFTGTASYISPEVYSNTGYNAKSDIWSLGCILYEMCSFTHAFENPRWIKLVSMIVNGPSPTLPSKYAAALNDILQRMLKKDPELRPSAKEILQFPYVTHRGRVLSEWLQEVIHQDRNESVDEDIARISAAMQENLHLDSLQAMREVQEMDPRQRRRIRHVEKPETHMKKLKRAVERVYEENQQRMRQNTRHKENDDVNWVADRTLEEKDICSEHEESSDGSVLLISLPLSEQQNSTISAYQNFLQRFLDSGSNTVEIQDSASWDSEDTTVSVSSKQEIMLLRQECVQLLGEDAFLEVYNYWKQVYNQQDPDSVETEDNTVCEPQVMKLYPQHCYKVQQLLFLEERIEVESPEPSFTWL
ncbi:serine/threonine-protein kinase Nek11-like [Dendropsophus ebraccatus]|uniref:serine/threonine-protein kinase Nek11-like n=1 Tax=Dendropsophus ebraccatus TaxID=150705 RepID=UPI003830FD27